MPPAWFVVALAMVLFFAAYKLAEKHFKYSWALSTFAILILSKWVTPYGHLYPLWEVFLTSGLFGVIVSGLVNWEKGERRIRQAQK